MSRNQALKAKKPRKHERLEVLNLRGEACAIFVNALLNPPKPKAAARAAARRYKKQQRH